MRIEMIEELYPGQYNTPDVACDARNCTVIIGLDKLPRFLSDTMLPTTSPEKTMEATVLVNGGYDPCHYKVRMNRPNSNS